MTYNKDRGLRIGVLLLDTVQLLDAAPVDLFGMLSAPYMRARDFPPSLISLALENVTILYISPTYDPNSYKPSASFAECTAESALRVTRSLTSPDCSPGALDILLIPGPPTSYKITPDVKNFVRAHTATEGTTVMTVCVGVYVAAQAGILDGKTATAPLWRLAEVKKKILSM